MFLDFAYLKVSSFYPHTVWLGIELELEIILFQKSKGIASWSSVVAILVHDLSWLTFFLLKLRSQYSSISQ